MTGEILEKLQQITPEEQRILSGEKTIEKEIYMEENSNVIDATKLLEAGKLIQVRTHTRFIHFPEHTHNYVEMIYMCSGSTHHVINGEDVILKQGFIPAFFIFINILKIKFKFEKVHESIYSSLIESTNSIIY